MQRLDFIIYCVYVEPEPSAGELVRTLRDPLINGCCTGLYVLDISSFGNAKFPPSSSASAKSTSFILPCWLMVETNQGERILRRSDDLLASEPGCRRCHSEHISRKPGRPQRRRKTHLCMWEDSLRLLSYLFMLLSSVKAPASYLVQNQWRVKDILWICSSSFIFLCSSSQLVYSLDACLMYIFPSTPGDNLYSSVLFFCNVSQMS